MHLIGRWRFFFNLPYQKRMPPEYQVLARKWRPSRFSDMVGQDHITKTLRNALMRQRTAHAYLFVGPRGIGKTTIARIFAKALNCAKAPAEEPCCECEACVSISAGNCIDVIEIDGASNNKVEDVRELREAALYTPVSCRYKIYIIDEVHMLSPGAWNALLKIVEEPPKHVKFIFATTEAHKVLPTIVSRCQRFDLRRIPTKVIAERILGIASAEGVQVDRRAAEAVAKAADGGMRDALSLLDQLIAFHAGEAGPISEDLAISVFGLASSRDLEDLALATLRCDASGIVTLIHRLAEAGKNLESVLEYLLDILRGIGICVATSDPGSILDEGEEAITRYRGLASGSTSDLVQRLLELLSPIGRTLHEALNKQVYLETAIIKAARTACAPKVEDLIARLNQLRGRGELAFLESPSIARLPQQAAPSPQPPTPARTSIPAAPAAPASPAAPAPVATPAPAVTRPPPAAPVKPPPAMVPPVAAAPSVPRPAAPPPPQQPAPQKPMTQVAPPPATPRQENAPPPVKQPPPAAAKPQTEPVSQARLPTASEL